MTYYSCDLNDMHTYNFWVYIGAQALVGLCSSMYAFFIASLVQNENALASLNIVYF